MKPTTRLPAATPTSASISLTAAAPNRFAPSSRLSIHFCS
jgi:hypothetical protein